MLTIAVAMRTCSRVVGAFSHRLTIG